MSENIPQDFGGFTAGSRVGAYVLEEQIGRGGMAVVFRARDERLGRRVALKVLAPALAADAGFRQRFIRESRAAAAVDDPHIIPLFEAGEADGVLFIAMRYVHGGDVRSLILRDGALTAARAAALVSPVASALDAAHAAGLVHRDVKPANMLLDVRPGRPDHVYLADFGLSKEALGSAGLTGTGQFLGTVDYAAPEQAGGGPVDGRADQYALGCAAFDMLCGQPPFRRDHAVAVLHAHLSQPPPRVTSRRPGLPGAVDDVFARVLAKAPPDRYASCREFSDALRDALGIAPYDADPPAGHQDTELALAGSAATGADDIAARPTEAAARIHAANAIPPSPPGTLPATQPAPGPTTVSGSNRAMLRWPITLASAAAAAAVVAVVVSLTGHTPTAAPPASPPRTTASHDASHPATSTVAPSATTRATPAGTPLASTPPTLTSPGSTWIAQLASVAFSKGITWLDQTLARIQQEIPGAQILDSSGYASLRPGYWVIYYAGTFTNGTQALAYCAAHGRPTKNLCIGRYLSHNPADFGYQCYPPATNPGPACIRP